MNSFIRRKKNNVLQSGLHAGTGRRVSCPGVTVQSLVESFEIFRPERTLRNNLPQRGRYKVRLILLMTNAAVLNPNGVSRFEHGEPKNIQNPNRVIELIAGYDHVTPLGFSGEINGSRLESSHPVGIKKNKRQRKRNVTIQSI
jgi:hypothetical protein